MAMDTDTRRAFLKALDEDETFRQEVRQRLLSKELLELPEKFAAFSAHVNEFIDEQRQTNAEFRRDISGLKEDYAGLREDVAGLKEEVSGLREDYAGLREDVAGLKGDVGGLKEDVSGLKGDVGGLKEDVSGLREDYADLREDSDSLKASLNRLENRVNRIADDIGLLKGNVAFYAARERFEFILEQLKLEYVYMLPRQDLVDMMRQHGPNVDFPDRRSFYEADLVFEAQDGNGAPCYVAVEASYTADRRDSDRVARNAEYLTLFTGYPAYGVIASVDNDREILPLFEAGTLHWFQLNPADIQAR